MTGQWVYIVVWLILGAIAGWAATEVWARSRGFGLVGNLVVGAVGGLVGGWLFRMALGTEPLFGSAVTAFLGASVLLALVGVVSQREEYDR